MEISKATFLLVFYLSVACSHAYTFYVGGREGWVLHPSESYSDWAGRNRFQVNDTLVFKYKNGEDSVLEVSQQDFDQCNLSNPIQKMDTGDSVFKFDRSGPFFFVSGTGDRCKQGQKLVVVVLAIRPIVPAPPMAPTLSPGPNSPVVGPPGISPASPPTISPVAPPPGSLAPSSLVSPPTISPVSPPTVSPAPSPFTVTPPTISPVSPPTVSPAPSPFTVTPPTISPVSTPTVSPAPSPFTVTPPTISPVSTIPTVSPAPSPFTVTPPTISPVSTPTVSPAPSPFTVTPPVPTPSLTPPTGSPASSPSTQPSASAPQTSAPPNSNTPNNPTGSAAPVIRFSSASFAVMVVMSYYGFLN